MAGRFLEFTLFKYGWRGRWFFVERMRGRDVPVRCMYPVWTLWVGPLQIRLVAHNGDARDDDGAES